jgi:hypothetical protein
MQAHSIGRAAWLAAALVAWQGTAAAQAAACHAENTVHADVVAIDMPMVFNRLGAQNVNWQMYALRHDLVVREPGGKRVRPASDAQVDDEAKRLTAVARDVVRRRAANAPPPPAESLQAHLTLRPDLRPRPLVVRMAAGECLAVRFTNLLTPVSNPFEADQTLLPAGHPMEQRSHHERMKIDDQVASRRVGFHPNGLQLVGGIDSDGSHVGANKSSLAGPGEQRSYTFFAPAEGSFLVTNAGAALGGEGTAGTSGTGLFGAVAVQPVGGLAYRGQVTEEELRLATRKWSPDLTGAVPCDAGLACTPNGQPVIDYEAVYPTGGVWSEEGKAGRPILAFEQWQDDAARPGGGRRVLVHGDINAIVAYGRPQTKRSAPGAVPAPRMQGDGHFPPDTYPLESTGKTNPSLPNRLEPFREFVSVFHDENAAAQAFPGLFDDPVLGHTLHGVRDAFMINYGSGGVGAEVIANRLKVGPMGDCMDCAFEEFFLSSFTVGDPALLVDVPANVGLESLKPGRLDKPDQVGVSLKGKLAPEVQQQLDRLQSQRPGVPLLGPKAEKTYYPHDPANVHHSYIGDFVKFRNLHTGKEQHIYHLHNHQWLFNPNDDNSNYIDAQAIGPGSGYTYEIAFGGSGNRNKSAGDAVFHCHYYPHFAQGMWYLWRIHDVFEAGTLLSVSGGTPKAPGIHTQAFALADGSPAELPPERGLTEKRYARALPDGEITRGTPIPAVVPLPGKALAPLPSAVTLRENPATFAATGRHHGSLAVVGAPPDAKSTDWNPGFPFWIAGIDKTVGSRPTTPPMDMSQAVGGTDGGLPRHAVHGYSAGSASTDTFTRLDAGKKEDQAKPEYFPEDGTPVEQAVMRFHAQRSHASTLLLPGGQVQAAAFITNGGAPQAGAPFFEPCMDDRRERVASGVAGAFFGQSASLSAARDGAPRDYFGAHRFGLQGDSPFDAAHPRIYKGANIQLDVTINKLGDHYPQQRILALWEDVENTLATGFRTLPGVAGNDRLQPRPPEPLVMRMNTFDCARYLHTNLVPKEFEMDDYQVRTPTDVIGQHIHLPKWDLPSADGSANGWNYEDGTFSPGMVRGRIHAINKWNEANPHAKVPNPNATEKLTPAPHYYFGRGGPFQLTAEQCSKLWETTPYDEFNNEKANRPGRPGQCDWLGARTTIQRWYSDPVVNKDHQHRGLGITFTHDHLGPSTHQQVGLYATMLTEPPRSQWQDNEKGTPLYQRVNTECLVGGAGTRDRDTQGETPSVRCDGGPTSWQAVIAAGKGEEETYPSHREFFLQFGDFQHAYRKDEFRGVNELGVVVAKNETRNGVAADQSFRKAITPSFRKPSRPNFPHVVALPDTCPGGADQMDDEDRRQAKKDGVELQPSIQRPCPEIISADDVGTLVVNYRQEPVAARVMEFQPSAARGGAPYEVHNLPSSGVRARQKTGEAGDLALAFQSRVDRGLQALNDIHGHSPYPLLTQDTRPGDPFTPILRAYSGDLVRVKIQAGSHEHEHTGNIHGLKWLQAGSGYGQAPHSGWRNSQNIGLSEQFTLSTRITDHWSSDVLNSTDRMYSLDASQDGLWNGAWGLIRTLEQRNAKADALQPLPQNPVPTLLAPDAGTKGAGSVCPAGAPPRRYELVAALANDILPPGLGATVPALSGLDPKGGTLVYNHRQQTVTLQTFDETGGSKATTLGIGPLHDPTAILIVRKSDLHATTLRLKPTAPLEPVVLRAAAGDCVEVVLENRLPRLRHQMPDLAGFTTLGMLMPAPSLRSDGSPSDSRQHTSFNNNHVRPSNRIGLHPQLLSYDLQLGDASVVGFNSASLVDPGDTRVYQWYAGDLADATATACYADAGTDRLAADALRRFRRHVYEASELQAGDGVLGPLVAHMAGRRGRLVVRPPSQPMDVPTLVKSLDSLLRGRDGEMRPADDDGAPELAVIRPPGTGVIVRPGPGVILPPGPIVTPGPIASRAPTVQAPTTRTRRLVLNSATVAALQRAHPAQRVQAAALAPQVSLPQQLPSGWAGGEAGYTQFLQTFAGAVATTLAAQTDQTALDCLRPAPMQDGRATAPTALAGLLPSARRAGATANLPLALDHVPQLEAGAAYSFQATHEARVGVADAQPDPLRCARALLPQIEADLMLARDVAQRSADASTGATLAQKAWLAAPDRAEQLTLLARQMVLRTVFLVPGLDNDVDPDGGAHDYPSIERITAQLQSAQAQVQQAERAADPARLATLRRDVERLQELERWVTRWSESRPLVVADRRDGDGVRLVRPLACAFRDIEFGGSNLTPPDPIKQGQKAAIGALVVEPKSSGWAENVDKALDRQGDGTRTRGTRASAHVLHVQEDQGSPQLRYFRDLVTVHQKGLNLRYGQRAPGHSSAVGPLSAERTSDRSDAERLAPEDAHDAGQMAINYGTEPLWFRFGIDPSASFGHGPKVSGGSFHKGEGFGAIEAAHEAFSEACCTSPGAGGPMLPQPVPKAQGTPATPVFSVPAHAPARMRMLMPTGVGRASTMALHGHGWLRDAALAERTIAGSTPLFREPGARHGGGMPLAPSPHHGVASQCLGGNALGLFAGSQDSISPGAHFDWVLASAGGFQGATGDYLLRDLGGFGVTSGLWATMRVGKAVSPLLRHEPRSACK